MWIIIGIEQNDAPRNLEWSHRAFRVSSTLHYSVPDFERPLLLFSHVGNYCILTTRFPPQELKS